MYSSDSSEQTQKPIKAHSSGAPLPEQEHLPCPRCDSTNTKFCYYNNYNFSQPRHFCKSCRRYWTQGGTLRDIPVGGGSRKNPKRSRTNSIATGTIVSTIPSITDHHHHYHLSPPTSVFVPLGGNHGCSSLQFSDGDDGDIKGQNVSGLGSFTSLLTTQRPGFDDLSFGHGRPFWPFPATSDGGGGSGGSMSMGNMWQFENGESGIVGGGEFCSTWPNLAISTSGNGLK